MERACAQRRWSRGIVLLNWVKEDMSQSNETETEPRRIERVIS